MNNREKIASVQHEIWCHWMKYLFDCCDFNPNGIVSIPTEFVYRWKRQIKTRYQDLSDKEKRSDLEQADKVIIAYLGM